MKKLYFIEKNYYFMCCFAGIACWLLFGVNTYAQQFKKTGFTGSIWHDCINLVGNDNQNQGHPGSLNTFDISLYNDSWTQKMLDSEDYYLFYESPWPLQLQKSCKLVNSILPANCSTAGTPPGTSNKPMVYVQLGEQGQCVYNCDHGVKSFSEEDKLNNPLFSFYMDHNQEHVGSYGQGLIFIFSRLVRDMLGVKVEGQIANFPCSNMQECLDYCKQELFSRARGALPFYVGDTSSPGDVGAATGPAYGYVKNMSWIIGGTNNNGEGPCQIMTSNLGSEFLYTATDLIELNDTTITSSKDTGCVFNSPDGKSYFNPVQNTEKIINYAYDSASGGGSQAASMIECLCDSVFQGATY